MGRGGSGPRAHRIALSPATHEADGPVDHRDAVAVAVAAADHRTPEQWLRSTFEDAPLPLRGAIRVGWRFGLLLQLTPGRSPTTVLGWRVVASDADAVRVDAQSVLMTARLVLRLAEGAAVLTTNVCFSRPLARPIWTMALPVHRLLVPYLLGRAARRPATHRHR
jgi:hypothetical protein